MQNSDSSNAQKVFWTLLCKLLFQPCCVNWNPHKLLGSWGTPFIALVQLPWFTKCGPKKKTHSKEIQSGKHGLEKFALEQCFETWGSWPNAAISAVYRASFCAWKALLETKQWLEGFSRNRNPKPKHLRTPGVMEESDTNQATKLLGWLRQKLGQRFPKLCSWKYLWPTNELRPCTNGCSSVQTCTFLKPLFLFGRPAIPKHWEPW